MLAIGDRDYRTDTSRRKELRTYTTRAKSPAYQLTFALRLWEANEIENYLLDPEAIMAMLGRQACEKGVAAEWRSQMEAFVYELDSVLRRAAGVRKAGDRHAHPE